MKKSFIVLYSIAAVLVGYILYQFPEWETQKLVKQEAAKTCATNEFGYELDVWESPLHYEAVENEDHTVLVCTVTSAGRDEIMDTDDDITGHATNLNKSKILGRCLGQKSVQIYAGWVEGRLARLVLADKFLPSYGGTIMALQLC